MTINYIIKGFDKDFYNFDAVVVPVTEILSHDKNILEVYKNSSGAFRDFNYDLNEIKVSPDMFQEDGATVIRSEKTGIYYIFILTISCRRRNNGNAFVNKGNVFINKNYSNCCKEMVKYINKLDVKNVLIHPLFNRMGFSRNHESSFLADTLKSSIDRFSRKNIYILVEEMAKKSMKLSLAFRDMENGIITPEECRKIYTEFQMKNSLSYANSLIRTAEIETVYKPKTLAEQFIEDMNNDSWFFYEYINRYKGTDAELARNADISSSTVSRIKKHDYKEKSKKVVISLAIALDLTVNDRKRFINSAGFSYPNNEEDYLIEIQLKKKRYNNVSKFNQDIWDEHPNISLGARSPRRKKDK